MKFIVIVIVVVAAVFAVDGVRVANDRRDINSIASDAANAAAVQIRATHDANKGRAAADSTVKSHSNAVLTKFVYNPVAAKVNVTVSGSADTLVLHYFDKGVAAPSGSASASP